MASIGGMDLGYGSQTQIVRTNVLCIALSATGMSSAANAHYVHNQIKEGLKGSMIEPDFTYFYETDDVDGSGYTEAAADAIFDQDASGDGTAELTALSVDGLVRDIRQVPLCPGSAHADALLANSAFGTPHALQDVGSISGNLMCQGILSLSAVELADTAVTVDQGLFVDNNDSDASPAVADANEVAGVFTQYVAQSAMSDQYVNMMADAETDFNRGGLNNENVSGISTGARKGPYTLNLVKALEHMDLGYTSGATVGAVDGARAAGDKFGAIMADISGQSTLIQCLSLAKVC